MRLDVNEDVLRIPEHGLCMHFADLPLDNQQPSM